MRITGIILASVAALMLAGCSLDPVKHKAAVDDIERRVTERLDEGINKFLDRVDKTIGDIGEEKELVIRISIEDKPKDEAGGGGRR